MKAAPVLAFAAQWQDLEVALRSSSRHAPPLVVDSALDPAEPAYAADRPTLFRERHGWCPYSERVWLALEAGAVPHDTIRIDNTGPGRRPGYFGGQTPQMRWPDGRVQGESMDLVREVNERYGGSLYPAPIRDDVLNKERLFGTTFPSKARPSSRAAFLFGWSGEPLWRSEFEAVLSRTDDLLGGAGAGPFFCGEAFTAADVAWAPFLERYAAQLPCLHEGLDPRDATAYPRLHAWFEAMDTVPAYACRVKGNPSSWRKVLTMAGYGNAGVPPAVGDRMADLGAGEGRPQTGEERAREQALWDAYRAPRPHLARTPAAEAGRVLMGNRDAIARDTLQRTDSLAGTGIPLDERALDEALRALAALLVYGDERDGHYDDLGVAAKEATEVPGVFAVARFLDERMCVPRDMGAMSAEAIKRLSTKDA